MVTILLDCVFALCLLGWLAFLTMVALMAVLIAAKLTRMAAQALVCNFKRFRDRLAWRERLRHSDGNFLRAAGIKR